MDRLNRALLGGLVLWCSLAVINIWKLTRWMLIETHESHQRQGAAWFIAFLAITVLVLYGIRWMIRSRNQHYKPKGLNKREFFTTFIFGRSLTWIETLYRMPKRVTPSIGYGVAVASWTVPTLLVLLMVESLPPDTFSNETMLLIMVSLVVLGLANATLAGYWIFNLMWGEYTNDSEEEAELGGAKPQEG